MGRTIRTRRQGSPTGRWISSQTKFLPTGPVSQSSLPYFEPNGAVYYTNYQYDVRGRATRTAAPDGTVTLACFDDLSGANATIDGNGHKKRFAQDLQGRVVEIDEYTGTFSTCGADLGTPYARTLYQYPPLETDIFNALSTTSPSIVTSYDTLGRKVLTSDPDLGNWAYTYDPVGNIQLQTDANGKAILFRYDALNRVTSRHYCASPSLLACQAEAAIADDVFTTYDDPAVAFSKGRVTNVSNGSTSTSYTYDAMGRQTTTTRVINERRISRSGSCRSRGNRLGEGAIRGTTFSTKKRIQVRAQPVCFATNVQGSLPA